MAQQFSHVSMPAYVSPRSLETPSLEVAPTDHLAAGVTYLQFPDEVCFSTAVPNLLFPISFYFSQKRNILSFCHPMTVTFEIYDTVQYDSIRFIYVRSKAVALASLIQHTAQTTKFMQMILSSSSLSTHSTLTQVYLTFKTLFNRSLPG